MTVIDERTTTPPHRPLAKFAKNRFEEELTQILRPANAWLAVVITGVMLFALTWSACAITGNHRLWPALLLVGALIVPVTAVTFVAGKSARFRVGALTLIVVATVGGVVTVSVAAVAEHQIAHILGGMPTIAVGLIEESVKAIVPAAMMLLIARYRNAASGLVLGMACGGGFAVVETLGYTATAAVRAGADLAELNEVILDRSILSPVTHIAWTGIVMAGLGHAAARGWLSVAAPVFVGTLCFSVLVHTWWDSSGGGIAYLWLTPVSVGALWVGTLVGRKRGFTSSAPTC